MPKDIKTDPTPASLGYRMPAEWEPHEAVWLGLAWAIVAMTAHPKVVGIGETGLDYYYDHSDRDRQRDSFRAHIAASRETALPLIVHTRDAEEDTAEILTEEMGKGAYPGVIHCFSSGPDVARRDRKSVV